jgi:hypothetical protein
VNRIVQLSAQVEANWDKDWTKVIEALEAWRALEANSTNVVDKLYSARVSYGNNLIKDGFPIEGAGQCQLALDMRPEGIEAQACVRAATPTPSGPRCAVAMARNGAFYNLWVRYANQLSCPQTALPLGSEAIKFNEQWFEKGHMFFFSSGSVHFVIVAYGMTKKGETGRGTWQQISSEPWSGRDENFCDAGGTLDPPVYDSFNKVWCNNPSIRPQLGGPTQHDSLKLERIFGTANVKLMLAQGFANGFIYRDSDGNTFRKAYIFFNNGTYIRDSY